MAIPHNYAPGSKRPWDHDLGNDSADVNAEATTTQSNVAPVEHDIDEIKEVLQNCLDGISTAADRDWAFRGPLLHAANPGLTLPRSGIVGLPLSPHDVSRIQDEARGGISNTENPNAGYSSCWILSAEQFALRNPAWAKFVKDLVLGTIGSSAGSYQIDLVGLRLDKATESSSVKVFDLT